MASYHRKHQTNGQNKPKVVVVMVPFPAQSHLNQLLHLSRLMTPYDIPIHYVSTTTHIRQAKSRIQGWDLNSATNFYFHEFPTPSFQSPPPNPNGSTKFPAHLQPLFKAALCLREPVSSLLLDLASTAQRIVVIHDILISGAVQDLVKISNAEAYSLQSLSAFNHFSNIWEAIGRPSAFEDETLRNLPSGEGCVTPEFLEILTGQFQLASQFDSGMIHNVSKVIESKYFDILSTKDLSGNMKQWALGPFNPVSISDERTNSSNKRHKCLDWLDKQDPNSVMFVSFGTTISLTDEQIHELAIGLEKSEQKFIWVLRDADKGDIYAGDVRITELPKGYEERIEGKGMIFRDWVPQLEILAHPSIGGFMSHCGWNSCMESITMGVPIAAWPMHSDQPRNAMLITDILKIGALVRDWARRDELMTSLTIDNAIRTLLASKEGDEIRERAAEIGDAVRRSVAEGGVTHAELDSFITHITRV